MVNLYQGHTNSHFDLYILILKGTYWCEDRVDKHVSETTYQTYENTLELRIISGYVI